MITSHTYGTWRSLEFLNVSWSDVLALVLSVDEWNAWIPSMEVGSCGCIYNPQPPHSRCPFSTIHEWSTPLDRIVRPYTSTAGNTMVRINGYINDYKCIKCIVRCQIKQPWTIRKDTKNEFYRIRHLRVFLVFYRQTVHAWGPDSPCLVSDDTILSIGQSVVEVLKFA
jgi:hypothetical protein